MLDDVGGDCVGYRGEGGDSALDNNDGLKGQCYQIFDCKFFS